MNLTFISSSQLCQRDSILTMYYPVRYPLRFLTPAIVINALSSSICITFIVVGYAIATANAINVLGTSVGLSLANAIPPATLAKLDVAVLIIASAILSIETIFACVDITVVIVVVVALTIGFDAHSSVVSLTFIIVGLAITAAHGIKVSVACIIRKSLAHTIHPITLAELHAAVVTTVAIARFSKLVKLAPVDIAVIVPIRVTVAITFATRLVVRWAATLGFGATLGVSILVAVPVLRFVRWGVRIWAAVGSQAWQINLNIGKLICSKQLWHYATNTFGGVGNSQITGDGCQ